MQRSFVLKLSHLALGGFIFILVGFAGGLGLTVFQSSQLASRPDFASLNGIYDVLVRKFDGPADKTKLLDGAKKGLLNATGDPYTVYLTAEEAKELDDDLSGTLSGIGAEIAIKNNQLTVVAPIADSPAEKAGLKPGDAIIRIDDTDSSGLTLEQAVRKIRGAADTQVKLKVVRGNAAPTDYTITRAVITVASVKSSMKPGGVGYLQVTRFGSDTGEKLHTAAADLQSQGATKFVLDLRNDPGGYLEEAVTVTSQFLNSGELVVEQRKDGKSIEKLYSKGQGSMIGKPTVVLINAGSASASEIVAGALQDHKVATLVGETSFGKGSVQEISKLAGGAELKITVAHWYTPAGKNITKEGIKPDHEVKLSTEDYNAGRDPQLDKALQILAGR